MNHLCSPLVAACLLVCTACMETIEPAPRTQSAPVAAESPTPATKLDGPMPDHLTLEYRACEIDTDCVPALNGCCDCANGGRDIAVNRARASDFTARFLCPGACTERAGDCGNGTISCQNKLCTFVALDNRKSRQIAKP